MTPVFSLLSALCSLLLLRRQQMECRQLRHGGGTHKGIEQAARPTSPRWTAPGRPAMAWTVKMPGETKENGRDPLSLNNRGREVRRTD